MKIKIVDDEEYYTFNRRMFYSLVTLGGILLVSLLGTVYKYNPSPEVPMCVVREVLK